MPEMFSPKFSIYFGYKHIKENHDMAHLSLPPFSTFRSTIIVLLIAAQILLPFSIYAQSDSFVPIPPTTEPLYHFNFEKLFYSNDAAWQKDLNEFRLLKTRIEGLRPNATSSATNLLETLEIYQKLGILQQRLDVYGQLRYSVNTNDTVSKTEGNKISDDFDAIGNLLKIQVQDLTDDQIQSFLRANPGLGVYRFLLQEWRLAKPHTGSAEQETLLTTLSRSLNPFDKTFYNLMGTHLNAPVSIGNRTLNAVQDSDYSAILRAPYPSVREDGFRKRLEAYESLADLYSYALLEKIKAANSVSEVHKFPNAVSESLYGRYLRPETVDAVLKAFSDHASLTIRFQKAERLYQQKLLESAHIQPWDMELRPPDSPEPRFTISEASAVVLGATGILKDEYQNELKALLDPANGRLDIVAGKNRVAGDFAWGEYGPWVFYMNGYTGYVEDVVTLGHESAHVVQQDLMYKAKVPWIYSDGARYFMEGFAKVNELLVLDYLQKRSQNQSNRLFFLRELNSKLASVKFASMFWAAYATSFEVEAYRRAKEGALKKPEELHEIWAELGRRWVLNFDQFPDRKYSWIGTHHFFDAARYYSNYLFAWLLAVTLYERFQSDPASIDKYIGLMKSGFPDEPGKLLHDRLGIDLSDPKTLDRTFALVDKNLSEFERLVQ
jgi:oligoendopeptidase F